MSRRWCRHRQAVVAGLAAALWSTTPQAASVSWNAPAACPDRADVAEQLEAVRGGPLAGGPNIAFHASVTEDRAGILTLTVRAMSGEDGDVPTQTRVLRATRCDELVDAFVQIVSLALGPRAAPDANEEVALPPEPSPRAPAKAAVPTSTVPGEEATRLEAAAEPPGKQETARLTLLGVLDTASLGGASFALEAQAGVSLGSTFELRGVLGYFPPHGVTGVLGDEDAGGRLKLLFAGGLACAAWSSGAFRLPLCAGMEGGRLSASGTGVSQSVSDAVAWLAGRAEVPLGISLGERLQATVSGGVVLPLLRHDFTIAGAELLRVPAVAARASIGLEYALGRE